MNNQKAFIVAYFFINLVKSIAEAEVVTGVDGRVKRVVGPHVEASHTSKPWTVLLYVSHSICGGFLLDPRTLNLSHTDFPLPPTGSSDLVVTAAHCVLDNNVTTYSAIHPMAVIVGFGIYNPLTNHEAELRTVSRSMNIIAHEDYQFRAWDTCQNDIALIRLNSSVVFGPNVHPLRLSTYNTAEVRNCTLTGYGPGSDNDEDLNLTTTRIYNFYDEIGRRQTVAVTQNDSRTAKGDSGSAIVCYHEGAIFAHGVHSLERYHQGTRLIEYANLDLLSPWIKSNVVQLYAGIFYHHDLRKYLRYGLQNGFLPARELQFMIKRFMGCIPNAIYVKLEFEQRSNYRKVWTNNELTKHVLVKDNVFNPHDIVGHTVEQDVYHCATNCFIENSQGSCSYIVPMKYCFFSAKRSSCEGSSCIRFGTGASVNIYFNKTYKGGHAIMNATPKSTCTFVEVDNSMELPVYASAISVFFKDRPLVACPAALFGSTNSSLDLAYVNKNCLFELVHPYSTMVLPPADSLYLHAYLAPASAKRIPLRLSNRPLIGDANPLELTQPIPPSIAGQFLYDVENINANFPIVQPFNPLTGGHQSAAFSKPWMVYLGDDGNDDACQGVFVSGQEIMMDSSLNKAAILTTAECAEKLTTDKSIARFGVNLLTIGSVYMQEAVVHSKEVYPSVNAIDGELSEATLALIIVTGSLRVSKAVHPLSLTHVLLDVPGNLSRVSAIGWNMQCHQARDLQEIPMLIYDDGLSSTTVITASPLHNIDETCNAQHHTGRPLVKWSNNGEAFLLGLSSAMERKANGFIVESFLKVGDYLPWIKATMEDM